MKLQYHQATFDLLGREPVFSPEAAALLAQRQEACGVTFPAAITEWYSLDAAVEILAQHSHEDHPVSLAELGMVDEDWYRMGRRNFIAEGVLPVMYENQYVCAWAISLDDSDDPPVLVQVDPSPTTAWQFFADRFSVFVYAQVWDYRPAQCALAAQDRAPSATELAFLRQYYREGPRTYAWPTTTSYRFADDDKCILIWSDEKSQADWWLSATSQSSLRRLVRSVRHCGTLIDSLYDLDDCGAKLLQELSP